MIPVQRIALPVVFSCLLFGLAGCASPPPASPQPTLTLLEARHTPALRALEPALQRCAQDQPEIALLVSEAPANVLEIPPGGLALRLGDPPSGAYAARLADEPLVVVIHPDNPLESLSVSKLQKLFSGEIQDWEALGGQQLPVHPWSYYNGDDARGRFDAAVLQEQPLSPETYLAPDPPAVLAGVAGDPSAVGYVPQAWLDGSVKAIAVEPPITVPLLALAGGEPHGSLRSFLACLQSGAGQELIAP